MGASRQTVGTARPRHAWLRWAVVWHVVFGLALLLGAARALRGDAPAVTTLVVTAALAAAYARTNVVRPPAGAVGQAAGLLVSWGLWLAAIWLDVAFVPVGAFLAAHVCFLSLRWATPVAALFVAGIVVRETAAGDGLDPAVIGPVAVGAVVGVVLAAYVAAIARESAARADLIDELATTRADLARAERDRGVLEERRRVARDVHDALAQSFTAVITQLQAAQATGRSGRVDAHVDTALAAARGGLAEARRIVWDLDADVPPLDEGLRTLVAAAATHGLEVEPCVDGVRRDLPQDVRRELLAIAREALTNVARHAATGRARLHLAYGPDRVTVEVSDRGQGFDPGAVDGGYGLRAMRERAARIGADVEVASDSDRGTRVRVQAPLA